jgi:hypothetical protein
MNYGFATGGQSVDAEVRQLNRAGCGKVFREIASGTKPDRAQLRRALGQLATGDVLMVMKLDRFARSTRDSLNTQSPGRGRRGADRRPEPWCDHGKSGRADAWSIAPSVADTPSNA